MKIQSLAVMFIILILPISIVLSEYTQNRVETLSLQAQYDSKLIGATYDALKAYQLNSFNSDTESLTNSKLRDINASVNTFFTSLATNFSSLGYTKETLQYYVPAVVYTMYDGYYIYSPYTNTWYNDDTNDDIKSEISEQIINQSTYSNGENLYGLKPYIYYSCRYIGSNGKGNYDVVITYSLDDYITIQGTVAGGIPVSKYGYILSDVETDSNGNVFYKGVEIGTETILTESVYVDGSVGNYQYVKQNGVKYYKNSNGDVFTVIDGKSVKQAGFDFPNEEDSAKNYYLEAIQMREFINTYLEGIKTSNAVNIDGTSFEDDKNPYTNMRKNF